MPRPLMIVALLFLSCCALAQAQGPQLKLPNFEHLRSKAIDSVDVTIGALPLTLARWCMPDSDPDSAAVKSMLRGVKNVKVRHFEFADDFVYSQADLDSVRAQLSGNGWSSLVQVRDRRKNEDVGVYVAVENEKITGFVVVASEPREFTIVNVVGTLDLEQVQAFRERMESGRLHFHHDGERDDEDTAHDVAESHADEPTARL
jgi:hypothetical protein